MRISGREVRGGSAYSVPYEVWVSDDPERKIYDVVQGWDLDDQKFLVLGMWVDSWADVERLILEDRFDD